MTSARLSPLLPCIMLAILASGLTVAGMLQQVPLERLAGALFQPDPAVFSEVYVHFSLLPRMAVAALAGAALAFTGAIFQQLLRNPLAEPATLGVLSGAQLAITVASLSLAGLGVWQRELAGLCGALLAISVVAILAARTSFSPTGLLLCGMVISLVAGSASVIVALFHHEYLRNVFIWASGSLIQNDFSNAIALAIRMAIFIPLLLLFTRPLTIAGLDDASIQAMGISPAKTRAIVLFLATALAAMVVARVGVIAFIGFASANLAHMTGARTFRQRLLWAPAFGAAMLLFADGLVLVAARFMGEIPTGTLTAIAGSILMLVMLRRVPPSGPAAAITAGASGFSRLIRGRALPVLMVVLTGLVLVSLLVETYPTSLDAGTLVASRWPRVLTSACAGAMLALAGSMIQAMTGNPMASPESLGVSGGAGLGIVASFFVGGLVSPLLPLAGGATGAILTLGIVMAVARKRNFAPDTVLLAGVATGALMTSIISLIVASGDPRAVYILAWTMGPTFRATAMTATIAAAITIIALVLLPLTVRWLAILPLGPVATRSLGMGTKQSRAVLMLFSAFLTASATLIVGPLSFVGLMAPHLARMTGNSHPLPALLVSATIGAILMTGADLLGRVVNFPYEIPAGVLAAFIGGPYFLLVTGRSRR